MYAYELLEKGCYYLVRETENSALTMIKVVLESDHAVFVQIYNDRMDTAWKMKKEPLADIVECLTDETVRDWQRWFHNSEDAYFRDDEEM